MKRYVRGIVSVLICLMAHVAFAEDIARNLLVVRPEGSWPPWEMVSDSGEPTGIHIALVKETAKALNLSVSIKTYPWKRAIEMLKHGQADAITYMTKTDERETFGYFFDGNVLSVSQIGFFVLDTHRNDIHFEGDIRSLKPYIIGTCRGYSYDETFDKADFLIKDEGAADEKILLQKMMAGRFKLAIGYVDDVKYNAKQMGLSDRIVFLRPYLSEDRVAYLVFSKAKGHEALARQFADTMEAFKNTPEYHDLLKVYGVEPIPGMSKKAETSSR